MTRPTLHPPEPSPHMAEVVNVTQAASARLERLRTPATAYGPDDMRQSMNLSNFQRKIESFSHLREAPLTESDNRQMSGLSAALNDGNVSALKEVREGIQETVNQLSQKYNERLPKDQTKQQLSDKIDLRRRLEVMQAANALAQSAEQALRTEKVLPIMQSLHAELDRVLKPDWAALANIEERLQKLRTPGFMTLERMAQLDRDGITYLLKAGARVGPKEFYDPSLVLPDGHIRIGTDTRSPVYGKEINCTIATWVAVIAPRLLDLEKEFGSKAIVDALKTWFIRTNDPPTAEIPEQKGAVAVIENLNLGSEIHDLQDIRKGDVLVQKYRAGGIWHSHEAVVEDVMRDPYTGKIIGITTISANIPRKDPEKERAIKRAQLGNLQDYLEGKNDHYLFVARLFDNPPDMSLPKAELLQQDRQLQAEADRLGRPITVAETMKNIENDLAAGKTTPEQAVKNLVSLLDLVSQPLVTQEDIDRIWAEAGGEGEPPRLK